MSTDVSPFTAPRAPASTRYRLATALALSVLVAAGPDIVWDVAAMIWVDRAVLTAAATFDAKYDPIVVEGGWVSVLGPRIINEVGPDNAFLVDPAETVPDAAVATSKEYVLVRAETIVQQQKFQRREFRVADLQAMLGDEPGASTALR